MAVYPSSAFGVPYVPPAPPVNHWPGVSLRWTGWDGSTFDLTGGNHATGVALRTGMRGLNMPPIAHEESESEARAGSQWWSARTLKREVFMPISVYQDTDSQAWIEYDDAFWRTMHPEKPGMLTATRPDGQARSLLCRYVDDGGHAHDWTPGLFGWMDYGITLQAEQPYWTGTPITRSWTIGGTDLPFVGTNGGPPFQIAASEQTGDATIPNPGDTAAFITWTATASTGGISAGLKVGVEAALVGYTPAIPAGSTLVINNRDMTARLNGARASQNLSPRDFGPVPEGEEVALSITAGGAGIITATLTPLYFRAS